MSHITTAIGWAIFAAVLFTGSFWAIDTLAKNSTEDDDFCTNCHDLTVVNDGLRDRITELEDELREANLSAMQAWGQTLAPWHLRDDEGRVWRVAPTYTDPDGMERHLFALVPVEDPE